MDRFLRAKADALTPWLVPVLWVCHEDPHETRKRPFSYPHPHPFSADCEAVIGFQVASSSRHQSRNSTYSSFVANEYIQFRCASPRLATTARRLSIPARIASISTSMKNRESSASRVSSWMCRSSAHRTFSLSVTSRIATTTRGRSSSPPCEYLHYVSAAFGPSQVKYWY